MIFKTLVNPFIAQTILELDNHQFSWPWHNLRFWSPHALPKPWDRVRELMFCQRHHPSDLLLQWLLVREGTGQKKGSGKSQNQLWMILLLMNLSPVDILRLCWSLLCFLPHPSLKLWRWELKKRGAPGAAERQVVAAALWGVSCCQQDEAGWT